MASIEQRGQSYRVVWRNAGHKEYTTWPALSYAEEARTIVEGHRGRITAERVYADMGIDLGDSPTPDDQGPTLRQWCEEWLPSKTRITPGTRGRYEQQLRDRIYPAFGDTPLTAITPVMVGTWINSLRAAGLSPRTVTRYYSLLHTAMDTAVRHGLIPRNPCPATDFKRDQTADTDTGEHHAVYLTPHDYELLRKQFPDRWRPLLDCIVETGVRWSEVTALAAQHLVPSTSGKSPRLRVWRAWKEDEAGRRYLGTTKGRGKRSLPIGADLYATLRKLVDGMPPDTIIFRDAEGEALDYDRMYDRVWKPALLRARRCPAHPPVGEGEQLPDSTGRCRDYGGTTWSGQPCGARVVTGTNRCHRHYGPHPDAVSTCDCPDVLHCAPSWHDLRHTHAAWLFSDPRMAPLAISRRLGHQQLATTSEIYGDLMPHAEETAVDAISAARQAGRAADV